MSGVMSGGLKAVSVCTAIAGVTLAAYAALLFPDDLGDGANPLPRWHRALQFGFAAAVPVLGVVAYRFAGRGRPGRAVASLAFAVVAFGGWVATFFDWS